MRSSTLAVAAITIAAACAGLSATTLERLSLAQLAAESTGVVHGTVTQIHTERSGPLVYTVAGVAVSTTWKGEQVELVEVSSPGGVWQGTEQRFPGAPRLEVGAEYILFLWQGPSGRIQPTGFSQGVLSVSRDAGAEPRVRREAVAEELLLPNDNGPQAASQRLDLSWSELDALLRQAIPSQELSR